ncbi:hypothetical protein An05g00660 [Aspergillus niger]|uniref:Uncharacterized protein n=2 Tax=Aspergillus niger TaxID=5061 RepID=A2QKM0_ASPNC|nr:hypothetical protein An05g00660 [Aspergillus niger]CAK39103.1 hypothetical protein An05g00660 [Aspergillus niger]
MATAKWSPRWDIQNSGFLSVVPNHPHAADGLENYQTEEKPTPAEDIVVVVFLARALFSGNQNKAPSALAHGKDERTMSIQVANCRYGRNEACGRRTVVDGGGEEGGRDGWRGIQRV